MNNQTDSPLIKVNNLKVTFPMDEGTVIAVEDVSMELYRGEVLGVVGESGCGKSVTAQAIMRIIPTPGRIDQGEILLNRPDGRTVDIARLSATSAEIREIRGKEVAMIFQEPMNSFSPLYTIGNQLTEAILLHQKIDKKAARELAIKMLEKVGIPNASRRIDNYPFEFSGGMRQRAMIAQALSNNPSLLVADEPTTALDVTIQAQILQLMRNLQKETNTSIIFITHNLGVVAQIASRIAIMYLGQVVEEGTVRDIFNNPKHPYTSNLLRAVPTIGKTTGKRLISIQGSVPSPFERPAGCPFHPRCDQAIAGKCNEQRPEMVRIGERHNVRCLLYNE
ncbi:MAG: ABC transporter ATP-binding protein [Chloroflexi bacterium]|nr:MAG: ABC transporter ATP-binding protein [Chloroflexota bacterium]